MSSVLDDKKKKTLLKDAQPTAAVTNQPATTTAAAPNSDGEYYQNDKGVWYKKLDFDKIPNNHAAARAAGYVLYKKPNGQITWANQTEDINDLGAFINGAWYEKVDNSIAQDAGRTFDIPQSTAAVKEETPATVATEAASQKEETPATVATEAASQKEETPAAPDTQASDDVVALEEVDVFGNRSHKKKPETTFPKNVSPFDIRGTRIPSDNARNAGVKNYNNYYHRSVLETLPKTPAAQSRYDKVIADIEAAKSPSALKRYHIREMNKEKEVHPYLYSHAVGRENWSAEELRKLIEDGKKRKETEPQKPQTPAQTKSTMPWVMPGQSATRSAQGTPQGDMANPDVMQGLFNNINTTQTGHAAAQATPVVKTTSSATPAATAQQTASEETPEQMTYTDLLKRFYSVMTPEEKAEQQRRQRNRQIINAVGDGISALANLYYTNKSGVNAYDPSTSLTKVAKERYDKLLAQQREDENRYKELAYRSGVADLEMAYKRERDAKADARAEVEAEYKRKRDEVEDGYKKSKEDREIAESNARVKKEEALKKYYEAYADYYNNGGKKPSTSGRGSTGSTGSKDSITLINDDGTKRTFRKADSVDYIHAAYAALPNEYKIQAKDSIGRLLFDKNGNPVYDDNVNQQQMQSAIARYNARKRPTAKASSKKNGGNKTNGKTIADEDYSQYIVE